MAEKSNNASISVVLGSDFVAKLGQSLQLTDEQIMKAKGSALQLASDPKLRDCDSYSLVRYCYSIARYNFSRDDAVYPVPYGKCVQSQMGYQGIRELAMRTGKYFKIDCVEVKECDSVTTNDDGEPVVSFEKNYIKRMNSPIVGYYAYARYKDGKLVKQLFWTKEQCEKHGRIYSKTYSSVWGNVNNFDRMCKKTLIKQLCKDLDSSSMELSRAINEDQMVYGKGKDGTNTYADNPNNVQVFDATSQQEAKTSVKNSILPPADEIEETMPKEEEKEAETVKKEEPKKDGKQPEPAKQGTSSKLVL